jgi:hypothetical protein
MPPEPSQCALSVLAGFALLAGLVVAQVVISIAAALACLGT